LKGGTCRWGGCVVPAQTKKPKLSDCRACRIYVETLSLGENMQQSINALLHIRWDSLIY
jgi:hypothetical protein